MIKLRKVQKLGVVAMVGLTILADAKPTSVNAELCTGLTAGVSTTLYATASNYSNITIEKYEVDVEMSSNPYTEEGKSFTELNTQMYTTTLVNMRAGATVESEVIEKINVGKKLEVLGYEDENWYKIQYDGRDGYVCSDYLSETSPFKLVSSTAYCNPNGNKTADCSDTIAGFTLAGMKEWLGKGCYIYNVADDGSVGSCRGYYEFHDTGWGRDGDIPRGETVDIYMTTEDECRTYGRQDIYILFVD